jgi:hypothetical protein
MNHPENAPHDTPAGYEATDVNIRAILWLAIGIAIGAVIVHAALWILLRMYEVRAERRDPALPPLAAGNQEPPGPRLQSAPVRDYAAFRAEEERALATYGWVDREEGIVRIPIERAMDLLVERGEPKVKPLAEPSANRQEEGAK